MHQIDEFRERFRHWAADTGVEGNADLGLIRKLLEARAEVLGFTDPYVWPKSSMYRTLMDVAPFRFRFDAGTRAALIRTLPVLGDFLERDGQVPALREDIDAVVRDLTQAGELFADRPGWAGNTRLRWLRFHAHFEPPAGRPGMTWGNRFELLSWERMDELAGPVSRPRFQLPANVWPKPVPPLRLQLPSVLAEAARSAPSMAKVIQVAEFLADRPKVWTGGRLGADVVQEVLDGTGLTGEEDVQRAWRSAVLAQFLWPTQLRAFRGESLDLWSNPDDVLRLWTDVVDGLINDLPDSLRDAVVRFVLLAYSPGADVKSVRAVDEHDGGREALQRLREHGLFDDGFALTPLACQGLILRWTNWPIERMLLDAGEWRPDLTVSDVRLWLRHSQYGLLTRDTPDWITTADPRGFAEQLVDVMLAAGDDRVLRAAASSVLLDLDPAAAPARARLEGTPLDPYSTAPDAHDEGESLDDGDVDRQLSMLDDMLAAMNAQLASPDLVVRPGSPEEQSARDQLTAERDKLAEQISALRAQVATHGRPKD